MILLTRQYPGVFINGNRITMTEVISTAKARTLLADEGFIMLDKDAYKFGMEPALDQPDIILPDDATNDTGLAIIKETGQAINKIIISFSNDAVIACGLANLWCMLIEFKRPKKLNASAMVTYNLDRLQTIHGKAVYLRMLGYTVSEIAYILGVSQNHVWPKVNIPMKASNPDYTKFQEMGILTTLQCSGFVAK